MGGQKSSGADSTASWLWLLAEALEKWALQQKSAVCGTLLSERLVEWVLDKGMALSADFTAAKDFSTFSSKLSH